MLMYLDNLKRVFLKRIGIILFVGILCAAALVFEKNSSTDFVTQSGSFLISELTKITDDKNKPPTSRIDYNRIIHTNSNLQRFLNATEKNKKFDYHRINSNWNTLSGVKKLDWMRGHVRTSYYQGGVLEFNFFIDENEAKDVDYLKKNASAFMKAYVAQSEKTIKSIQPKEKIRIIDETIVLPETKALPKEQILVKYGIIGFILGALVSTMVFFVLTLGKSRE